MDYGKVAQFCEYAKKQWFVNLKWVNCTVTKSFQKNREVGGFGELLELELTDFTDDIIYFKDI